jgi:hypothetical protein
LPPAAAPVSAVAGAAAPSPAASTSALAATAAAAGAAPLPGGPAPAAETGSAVVQLAATPDEGSAEAVWSGLQKKLPDLLAGKDAIILPAVINGASVWRVQLGGFASPDAAQAFCTQLAAKGAACTVAGS